jgi:hypothetical protein
VLIFGVGQQRILNRLRKGSRKLIGEAAASQHDVDDDDGNYYVQITYRFQSPQSGRTIEGTQQRKRNDLEQTGPPHPGTPVIVLYRDDKTYWML